MRMTFIDFETQGDDPATTNPTEVGAVVVERELKDGALPVFHRREQISQLMYDPKYPPQTDEIVELTGITDDMLKSEGRDPALALQDLGKMIRECDYAFAHNKKFDQVVYESSCTRLGVPIERPGKSWICTLEDVPYPKKFRCKQLAHLAFDHGLQFNRDSLHRALDDVNLLSMLITTKYPMEEILAYVETPWCFLFLNGVKPPWQDGGVSNAQAKKLKFGWQKAPGTDGPEFEKRWVKRVKETLVQQEKDKLVGTAFKLTKLSTKKDETRNEIPNIESGPVPENAPPI